ncbi:hypothetical protein NX059_000710 [Plenodomus lindquistii]|nr:hypothetical protein NX059_000710 [Plenodomus lindquistii]
MAEPTVQSLNYGYPGAASYDLDNSEWSYTRQHATRILKQIRPYENVLSIAPTLAVPASTLFPTVIAPANSTSIRKIVKRLIQEHPQLAPSAGLLPEPAIISSAVEQTTGTYDPLVGDLLSFGSTTIRDLHDGPKRIVAMPTGETGSVLRLMTIDRLERLRWETDRSLRVDGSTLKSASCGYWNEDAAPIRQVCFAQSEDRNTLLAVRLPTKTVLLRTRYHFRAQAAKPSQFYRLPASTVTAQSILSIGMNETGGAAHADVTFNPDYQLQIGIVDQDRSWSVWDIERRRKGDTYTITQLVEGLILPPDVEEPAGEDGWARILWVGDVKTLLVCCRRQLSIVSIKGDTHEYLPCPPVFPKRSLDWILDVQQHPRFRSRFFVLTSTCLLLMAVTTSSEALDASVGPAGAFVLASRRHYRHAEDFTLHICVQTLSDEESGVLLHSRLNKLVQVYSFVDHPPNSASMVLTSDPVPLDLQLDSAGRIAQLHIERMQYDDVTHRDMSHASDSSQTDRSVRFYRIFAAQTDFSVHELVVSSSAHTFVGTTPFDHDVRVHTENLLKYRRTTTKGETAEEGDGFVVPDGLEILAHPTSKTSLQAPHWQHIRMQKAFHTGVDYTILRDALTEMGGSEKASIDMASVAEQLTQLLTTDEDALPASVGTLRDVIGSKLQVTDVDEASTILQELLLSEAGSKASGIHRIASVRVLKLDQTEEPMIADIYDTILGSWVAPLPRDVPVHVRQQKERLARLLAAEVMLASRRIRYEDEQLPTMDLQSGPSQDSGIALPILPSKPNQGRHDATEQWPASQTLPTPPHSSVLSSSMPPSSPPISSFKPPAPSDPIARLSRHLQMRETPLTPTAVPPTVNMLLGHWRIGLDPHTYDWSTMEEALRVETLDETSQKQREKQRKKQERRERRQERENELMRLKAGSQPLLSSQHNFAQSSQGPILPSMGSSSQAPSQSYTQVPLPGRGFAGPGGLDILAPMSQVEPGRFGGRPDPKKKKRGRVSGF